MGRHPIGGGHRRRRVSDRRPDGSAQGRLGVPVPIRPAMCIPVLALGWSLSSFLALTYVLCILYDLWIPGGAMSASWLRLLPGFTWLSWQSFLLGLAEAFAYGWYCALTFGPLFNFIARRTA